MHCEDYAVNLHADLTLRVVDHAQDARWLPSPNPAVQRRMLDRIGGEVARATTIVRYAPDAKFARHVHGGGEEILVLEGVFSDEDGDYPAGTYLRNPPGSAHAPFSRNGCLLLVKLWQFAADDLVQVRIDTHAAPWRAGPVSGIEVQALHHHRGVETAMERWCANTELEPREHVGGDEILVVSGTFSNELGRYSAGSWLRQPSGNPHTPCVGPEGALVYVKVGHLSADFLKP